jgi:hypothetical protein
MVDLKRSEWRVLDDAFEMHSGYVLDFYNRTLAEFFEDEFGIEIYDEKYSFKGTSKANRLRAFVEIEDPHVVAHVLRALWDYRNRLELKRETNNDNELSDRFFSVLEKVEGGSSIPRTNALEKFKSDFTLEELIAAIDRDIQAGRPAAALDRLHTYCMKKFAHLLQKRGEVVGLGDPLQSRVGKYIKMIENERELREMTRRAAKSAISIFEAFNDIRNNKTFAHDNEILDAAEARFIFDTVSAYLRFLKSLEPENFGL